MCILWDNWKTWCFSNSNISKQEGKEARKEHSEGTDIDDTEIVDMSKEETERTSNAPDQDRKLEVENIMFIVLIVSIVTVS